MRYLSAQDILVIHARIIEESGGSHGVRETGLLLSIAERPKSQFGGKELFKGIFKKAAAYLEGLAHYHIFIDGNKRTAFAASARFLFINGYEFIPTNEEIENFMVETVVKKHTVEFIAEWIKSKSVKGKKS